MTDQPVRASLRLRDLAPAVPVCCAVIDGVAYHYRQPGGHTIDMLSPMLEKVEGKDTTKAPARFWAVLVAGSLCDRDGVLVYDPTSRQDIDEILGTPAPLLKELGNLMAKESGLVDEDDDAGKAEPHSSGAAPNGSGSPSPAT